MSQKRVQHYRIKNCVVCGKAFRSARHHAKTCSGACRSKLSRVGQKKSNAGYAGVTLQQLDMLAAMYA